MNPTSHPVEVRPPAPCILVIDDHPEFRASMRRMIEGFGYRVVEAEDADQGLDALDDNSTDVALVDIDLGHGKSGMDVLREAASRAPHTDYVVVTGDRDMEIASACLDAGASDYLEKPLDPHRLRQVLRRGIEATALRRERNLLGGDGLERLLFGHSPQMQQVRHDIRRYGPSSATVLIRGESGTGKELVARALHRASECEGPYRAFICPAVPETLFEGELFGWVKGAFTGASQARSGLLAQANNGTLLLDEIGDMPLIFQAKILRVVENRTFSPVGSDKECAFTGRILCATNKDLKSMVKAGEFRLDLMMRLDVVEIVLPPLRKRVGDVRLLTLRLIHEFNVSEGGLIRSVAPDVMAYLEAYHWPGNVRELRNVLQRAVILRAGEILTADLLPDYIVAHGAGQRGARRAPAFDPSWLDLPYAEAKEAAVRSFTIEYLKHHLREADNVVTRAASNTGMQPPNFHRLLKKCGLDRHDLDGPEDWGSAPGQGLHPG